MREKSDEIEFQISPAVSCIEPLLLEDLRLLRFDKLGEAGCGEAGGENLQRFPVNLLSHFSGVTFWAIISKYLWGKLFIQIFPMSQPPPCLDATYKLKHDDGSEMHSSDTSSWSQLRCGQCTTGERAGCRNLYSTQVQHQPPNLQLSIQKAAHHLTNPLMYECKYK